MLAQTVRHDQTLPASSIYPCLYNELLVEYVLDLRILQGLYWRRRLELREESSFDGSVEDELVDELEESDGDFAADSNL